MWRIVPGPCDVDVSGLVAEGHAILDAAREPRYSGFQDWITRLLRETEGQPDRAGSKIVLIQALEKMVDRASGGNAFAVAQREEIAKALLAVTRALAKLSQNEEQKLRVAGNVVQALDLCQERSRRYLLVVQEISGLLLNGWKAGKHLYKEKKLTSADAHEFWELCDAIADYATDQKLRGDALAWKKRAEIFVDWDFREFRLRVDKLSQIDFDAPSAGRDVAATLSNYFRTRDESRPRAWVLLGQAYLSALGRLEDDSTKIDGTNLDRELNEIAAVLLSQYGEAAGADGDPRYVENRALVAAGCAVRLNQPDRAIVILNAALAALLDWEMARGSRAAIHQELMECYGRLSRVSGSADPIKAMEEHLQASVRVYEPGVDPLLEACRLRRGRILQSHIAYRYLRAGLADQSLRQCDFFLAEWPAGQPAAFPFIHARTLLTKARALSLSRRWAEAYETAKAAYGRFDRRTDALAEICSALRQFGRPDEAFDWLCQHQGGGPFIPDLVREATSALADRSLWPSISTAVRAATTPWLLQLINRAEWPNDLRFDDGLWPALEEQARRYAGAYEVADEPMADTLACVAETSLARAYFADGAKYKQRLERCRNLLFQVAVFSPFYNQQRRELFETRLRTHIRRQMIGNYAKLAIELVAADKGGSEGISSLLAGDPKIARRFRPKGWQDACSRRLKPMLQRLAAQLGRTRSLRVGVDCAPGLRVSLSEAERVLFVLESFFREEGVMAQMLPIALSHTIDFWMREGDLRISGRFWLLAGDLDQWDRLFPELNTQARRLGFGEAVDSRTRDGDRTIVEVSLPLPCSPSGHPSIDREGEEESRAGGARWNRKGRPLSTDRGTASLEEIIDSTAAAYGDWLLNGSGHDHPRRWLHSFKNKAAYASSSDSSGIEYARRQALAAIKSLQADPERIDLWNVVPTFGDAIRESMASAPAASCEMKIESDKVLDKPELAASRLSGIPASLTVSAVAPQVFRMIVEELLHNALKATDYKLPITVVLRSKPRRFGKRTLAAVEIAVENPIEVLDGRGSGHGLAWLQELASELGGSFSTDNSDPRRWRSVFIVPRFGPERMGSGFLRRFFDRFFQTKVHFDER